MSDVKYVESNSSEWLEWIAPTRFNNPELFRIVIFYVFHSPSDGLSAMHKSLHEYGWSEPWKKPQYLNRKLKDLSTNEFLLFSADKYKNMKAELEKANLLNNFPMIDGTERICILNNKKNQFMSVFYHLRNAFAHCRLNMVDVSGEENDYFFILEDVYRDRVSARMILRKSTLLKWINLIEGGYVDLF